MLNKNLKFKIKNFSENGVSLIEILVVVTIFAVLGILATRAVLLTLRGTNRSTATVKVRENLNYALAVMERQLRNAQNVSPCPNVDTTTLNYTDVDGNTSSFSCQSIGPSGYVASGSARLTSSDVGITCCSIVCAAGTGGGLDSVNISLVAKDVKNVGSESAQATANTQIFLRTY